MKINNLIDLVKIDDVVSLEKAKQLKQQGFNLPTYFYYLDKDLPFNKKGLKRVKLKSKKMNHNKFDDFIYSAPTKKEVKKWINIKSKIKRGTVEWKNFVEWQESRIKERLERYNNIHTAKEQFAELGDLSLYQKYKIKTVSNFLIESLNRIKSGEYGTCKYCSCEIPFERLLLVPAALQCVKCDSIHKKS